MQLKPSTIVTIVIPTLNRCDELRESLKYIKRQTYILRFPNIYGENDPHNKNIIQSIINCLITGKELVLRTNLDSKRQFIYVKDVANIIKIFVDKISSGKKLPFKNHFGTPYVKTIKEILVDIEKLTRIKIKLNISRSTKEIDSIGISNENNINYNYTKLMDGLKQTLINYNLVKDNI